MALKKKIKHLSLLAFYSPWRKTKCLSHFTMIRELSPVRKCFSFQLDSYKMAPAKKGGRRRRAVLPSASGDTGAHHQRCSQAHLWSGLQGTCSSGAHRDPEDCHEKRWGHQMWASIQAQQSGLSQRNKEHSMHACEIIQKTYWGWRLAKQARHCGFLYTCHHSQTSTVSVEEN